MYSQQQMILTCWFQIKYIFQVSQTRTGTDILIFKSSVKAAMQGRVNKNHSVSARVEKASLSGIWEIFPAFNVLQ